MRIATGTFSHETNTFSNIPTSMDEFAKQRIMHGEEIPRRFRGSNAIALLLTEHRAHPNDFQYFRAFGIEPTQRQILVLKSAAHYRAAFEPIASEVIEVDAPGITSPRLERYPYQHIRRPIYPLDRVYRSSGFLPVWMVPPWRPMPPGDG